MTRASRAITTEDGRTGGHRYHIGRCAEQAYVYIGTRTGRVARTNTREDNCCWTRRCGDAPNEALVRSWCGGEHRSGGRFDRRPVAGSIIPAVDRVLPAF